MSGAMAKFLEEPLSLSVRREPRKSTKAAWAAYVRRRWPRDCQAHVMREWHLTPGRANGVVWSNITQTTIDLILQHPRGGAKIALEVLAIQFGEDLHGLIAGVVADVRRGIDHERQRIAAEEQKLSTLARRIAALPAVPRTFRDRMGPDDAREAVE